MNKGLALVLIAFMVACVSDTTLAETETGGLRVYTLAASFFTVRDSVSFQEVMARWSGADPLLLGLDQPTYDQLVSKFGPSQANTHILAATDLVRWAWANPDAWLIVPFDQLSSRLKVLQIDASDVFHLNVFHADASYPLAFAASAGHAANYDPAQLTTIAMTGVTAMTRGTAAMLDTRGAAWAVADVAPALADADLVHTSNEVSFTPDCPRSGKTPRLGDLCANDTSFDVLKRLHINVVELTGNHNNDYGYAAALRTLDLYRQNGIATFGGGADLSAAHQPLVVQNHGNTVMFVGCNAAGPEYAWATATTPGAARCEAQWLDPVLAGSATTATAKSVKIMDVQYIEYDQAWPLPAHRAAFAQLASSGADVVIGTQAHQPQTMGFIGNSFIHFGLGNFLFDQQPIQQREFFIDKLIVYRGRLISVELLTGIIEDKARPRLMSSAERKWFLQRLFALSQITNPAAADSE